MEPGYDVQGVVEEKMAKAQEGHERQEIEGGIVGQENTPYAGGVFKLALHIPDRYPFEPPQVKFKTPVYHPNIDSAGRICLDILKMPPKGAWKPSHNISTLLKSIHLLLSDPNPDDPLMADISSEFKCNRPLFNEKAKQWTKKYAMESQILQPTYNETAWSPEGQESNTTTSKDRKRCGVNTENPNDVKKSREN